MNTSKVILKPLFQKKADPLTLLLKDIFKDNRNAMSYLGALSIGLGFSQADSAFAEEDVEEVVVTASKREANLQDLPMAVQAITCLLYTSPSPRDRQKSRMPSSA